MLPTLLLVLLALDPRSPDSARLPLAEAIDVATDDLSEAILLAVVDLHETNWGRCTWRGHPCPRWGLVTPRVRARLAGQPLSASAVQARMTLAMGARRCTVRWGLHWFHRGECPTLRPRPCGRHLSRRACRHRQRGVGPTAHSERMYAEWQRMVRRFSAATAS